MKILNILIVEDEVLIANHIKHCIEKESLGKVTFARSYHEAISKLESNYNFSLVLIDVNLMGTKNGIDVAKYINEHQGIPFLFITSYTDSKTLSELQETSPEAYISKPFNNADIIATVSIILKKLKNTKVFQLKIGKTVYKLNLDNLVYVKSDHVYIDMVFKSETIVVRSTIKNLLEQLPKDTLLQVNRSVAVNPKFITLFTDKVVTVNNIVFKISQKYN